jgi:serine/threonine-protein kinase
MSFVGGTPTYMAPEQAGDPSGAYVSARSDLHALACTTFELLTNRAVFAASDLVTMLDAHRYEPPPAVSRRHPDLAPLGHAVNA